MLTGNSWKKVPDNRHKAKRTDLNKMHYRTIAITQKKKEISVKNQAV